MTASAQDAPPGRVLYDGHAQGHRLHITEGSDATVTIKVAADGAHPFSFSIVKSVLVDVLLSPPPIRGDTIEVGNRNALYTVLDTFDHRGKSWVLAERDIGAPELFAADIVQVQL